MSNSRNVDGVIGGLQGCEETRAMQAASHKATTATAITLTTRSREPVVANDKYLKNNS